MKKSISYFLLVFATVSFSIVSCSKKPVEIEEPDPVIKKVHSGGVYIQCDMGPYFFSIDSLIENCSVAKSLNDSIPFSNCVIDSDAHKLADSNNFDFKTGLQGHNLELTNTPISQKPVEVKTVSEGGKYPFIQFYNGYEIHLSENEILTLLFFNALAAGCWHDVMVWEYVETE